MLIRAKKKLIQVTLKTMFRLRKDKPGKDLLVKIAPVDELKKNGFKEWSEAETGEDAIAITVKNTASYQPSKDGWRYVEPCKIATID